MLTTHRAGRLQLCILLSVGMLTAADDPSLGTWKLNTAASTFPPGALPPRSILVTRAPVSDGIRYTEDLTRADGTVLRVESVNKYDGRDYPVTGMRTVDSVSCRRIDTHTVEVTLKKAGAVVRTVRNVVSLDGKTMTVTETEVRDGKPVKKIQVFDRQ